MHTKSIILIISIALSGCTVVSSDDPEWTWPVSYKEEIK